MGNKKNERKGHRLGRKMHKEKAVHAAKQRWKYERSSYATKVAKFKDFSNDFSEDDNFSSCVSLEQDNNLDDDEYRPTNLLKSMILRSKRHLRPRNILPNLNKAPKRSVDNPKQDAHQDSGCNSNVEDNENQFFHQIHDLRNFTDETFAQLKRNGQWEDMMSDLTKVVQGNFKLVSNFKELRKIHRAKTVTLCAAMLAMMNQIDKNQSWIRKLEKLMQTVLSYYPNLSFFLLRKAFLSILKTGLIINISTYR